MLEQINQITNFWQFMAFLLFFVVANIGTLGAIVKKISIENKKTRDQISEIDKEQNRKLDIIQEVIDRDAYCYQLCSEIDTIIKSLIFEKHVKNIIFITFLQRVGKGLQHFTTNIIKGGYSYYNAKKLNYDWIALYEDAKMPISLSCLQLKNENNFVEQIDNLFLTEIKNNYLLDINDILTLKNGDRLTEFKEYISNITAEITRISINIHKENSNV